VIIGFSAVPGTEKFIKYIYDGAGKAAAKNINPYLVDAPDVLVAGRARPICGAPRMTYGNKPSDGGHLILGAAERDELLAAEPAAAALVRPYMGSRELINGGVRHCLWLKDVPYRDLKACPRVLERVKRVKEFRLKSTAKATAEKSAEPHLFFSITQPLGPYLAVPRVSSEHRSYIPIGFVSPDIIASDALQIVPDATIYHFGILTSSVHMAWTRAVGGRLKSDYRYSNAVVYNTFPWPEATEEQKGGIAALAQAVLDARARYPESTLADMYNEASMPFHPELAKAHRALDAAVMKLYGFRAGAPEAEIVAALMGRYARLVGGAG
jgi:hypothetical protein